MADRERANFLHAAVTRAPGKRQIKPSAAIFDTDVAAAFDDDEDDEDFLASDDGSEKEDSEEDGSSSSSDVDDKAGSGDGDEDEEDEHLILEPSDENNFPKDFPKQQKAAPLICSICLNAKNYTKGVEVIQCDRCGVSVHEACYAVDDPGDTASNTSSASTEPWFCEPCMFGLNVVPHCELCPSRTGAFKKANVAGCWVHLLCALYTPGISFGDTDHLTAVSWQEMDYRAFGRKACVACTDKLDARTGATAQCEAGLCKNFYHATCAQKLGLLMDNDTDEHFHQTHDNHHHQHTAEFNFLLCKRHNHSDSLRAKREKYAQFMRQESDRMAVFNRQLLGARQEVKRKNQLQCFLERMKMIENFVTVVPGQNKRTRMLHNNKRFLNLFAEKAELIGIDADNYSSEFLTPPAEQISVVPPAFSATFVKYFDNREKVVFSEEEERLAHAKRELSSMLANQKNLAAMLKIAQERAPTMKESSVTATSLLNRFCNALSALNVPKKHFSTASASILTPPKKHHHPTSNSKLTLSTSAAAAQTSPGAAKIGAKSKVRTASNLSEAKLSTPAKSAHKRSAVTAAKKVSADAGAKTVRRSRTKGKLSTSQQTSSSRGSKTTHVSSADEAVTSSTTIGEVLKRSLSGGIVKVAKRRASAHVGLPARKRSKKLTDFADVCDGSNTSAIASTSTTSLAQSVDSKAILQECSKQSTPTVHEQQQQNLKLLLGNLSNSPIKDASSTASSTLTLAAVKKATSPIKRPNILSRSSPTKIVSPNLANLAVRLNSVQSASAGAKSLTTPLRVSLPGVSGASTSTSVQWFTKMSSPKGSSGLRSPKTASQFVMGAPLFGGASTSSGGVGAINLPKKNFSPSLLNSSLSASNSSSSTATKNDSSPSTMPAMLLLLKKCEENKEPEMCFTCKKTADQSLLVYCDTCKHHYHIGCLDPPLTKMPPKRKHVAFQCSDCAFPSSSSETEDTKNEDNENNADESTPLAARRKRRPIVTPKTFSSMSPPFVLPPKRHRRRKKCGEISSQNNSSLGSGDKSLALSDAENVSSPPDNAPPDVLVEGLPRIAEPNDAIGNKNGVESEITPTSSSLSPSKITLTTAKEESSPCGENDAPAAETSALAPHNNLMTLTAVNPASQTTEVKVTKPNGLSSPPRCDENGFASVELSATRLTDNDGGASPKRPRKQTLPALTPSPPITTVAGSIDRFVCL